MSTQIYNQLTHLLGTEGASSGIIPSFGSASGITAPFSQGPGAAFASNWVESSAAGAGSGSMRPRSGSTPFFSPAFHQVEKASEASGAARKGSDPGISRLHVRDPMRDIPVELQGVSVKELVRALGESKGFAV